MVRLLENEVVYGDMNGDGRADAIVLLALLPGGSAVLIYAVVVLDQDGAPRQAGVELLGDRIKIGRIEVANGEATIIYLTQRLTDRMCCPTQWTSKTLRAERAAIGPADDEPGTAAPL